jgi:hypothetical protein
MSLISRCVQLSLTELAIGFGRQRLSAGNRDSGNSVSDIVVEAIVGQALDHKQISADHTAKCCCLIMPPSLRAGRLTRQRA